MRLFDSVKPREENIMREFLQVMKEILTPIVLMALLYTLAYIVVRISRIAAAGLEKLRGEAERP